MYQNLSEVAKVPSGESSNKILFNTDSDYVVLYGCDACLTEIEEFRDSLSDDRQYLWDAAVDYSDGFTMESTWTFPTETIAKIVGFCVQIDKTGEATCWMMEWTSVEWLSSLSYYFTSNALTDAAVTPVLQDETPIDSYYNGLFKDWVL